MVNREKQYIIGEIIKKELWHGLNKQFRQQHGLMSLCQQRHGQNNKIIGN